MNTRDARTLSRPAQAELRRVAVRLHELWGKSPEEIAEALEVHPGTVKLWLRRWRQNGETVFESSEVRGHGARTYTPEQEDWILDTLRRHPDPRDLGIPHAGWTLAVLQRWLTKTFGYAPHISNVSRLLHRHHFGPRRPQQRAREASEEELTHFEELLWPEVVEQAEQDGAILVFLDESQVRQDQIVIRTWAKKGSRPVVQVSGRRDRINIISALSEEGDLWYACYSGTLNAERFVGYLEEIQEYWPKRRIVVVTDRHPAHAAMITQAAIESRLQGIELVFLPAYSPQLNPDEGVWNLLKDVVLANHPIEEDEVLADVVEFEMHKLQAQPELLRSIFGHPDLEIYRRTRHHASHHRVAA
jgi:transposase